MNNRDTDTRIKIPKLLLIAGNGRNVGKTYLACKIIKHLSAQVNIVGLKISPHFHNYDAEDVLVKSCDFVILKETKLNSKDSSSMLQAGAKQVYFVMAKQDEIRRAFEELKKLISDDIVVCESGGLIEIVEPASFLFVKRKGEAIQKEHLLAYSPIIVSNNGTHFDFDIQNISVTTNSIRIKT